MNPLTELAKGPSPILDSDQVEHLFGPITQVRVMYTTTLCMSDVRHYTVYGVMYRAVVSPGKSF